MFIAGQVTIAKIGNQLKCPSNDDWINDGVLLGHKKYETSQMCSYR